MTPHGLSFGENYVSHGGCRSETAGRRHQTAVLEVVVLQDFGAEENWLLASQSPSSPGKIAPVRAAPQSLYNHPFNLWITEQGVCIIQETQSISHCCQSFMNCPIFNSDMPSLHSPDRFGLSYFCLYSKICKRIEGNLVYTKAAH